MIYFCLSFLHAGVTYKGNAMSPTQAGNLAYVGDDETEYSQDLYKLADMGQDKSIFKKENPQKLIIDFIKRLSQVNAKEATDSKHPGSIVHLIDPQHTLIHMAINFLIGSWDGFWYQASNYYLHNELSSNEWTLITYDFDETYGNYLQDQTLNTVSYKNYTRPGSQRPLVEVFLNNTYYDGVFQDTLKTIVKRFFKPSIVHPRLQAWSKMLQEDIVWTRSIAGRSPGIATSFTLTDFQDSLIGNKTDSISLWITNRVSSLTTQLGFNEKDDLPPLPAYTKGTYLDAKGTITYLNGSVISANVYPGGSASTAVIHHPSFLVLSITIAIIFLMEV